MKKIFTISLIALLIFVTNSSLKAQTVYASLGSGAWNSGTVWETYPTLIAALAASPGGGTASTSTTNPSGTHFVLIRTGHTITMGAANRGCKGIVIQAGGKLWANEATARRLQIGAGGTGFTYPLVDTIQVEGALGAANDGIYIESGVNAQLVKLYGAGTIDILRIRTVGGGGAASGGVLNFNIDADVNLWQAGNYALSAVYNPSTTDNYTINIMPGKTVSLKAATGTFHNSQNSTTYGNYTYNINGILDLTTATSTSSILAPNPATSIITLNIDGGTLKLGTAFLADTSFTSPPSLGVLDFRIVNNGLLDATNTTNFVIGKTSDGLGGFRNLVFASDATGHIKHTVGASQTKFPIGVIGTLTPNTAYLNNSGTPDVFDLSIKSTIDNAPPTTNVVNRQWTITETVIGGSSVTLQLSWVTADQSAGFNPANPVYILRYTGSGYESFAATVSGTGTSSDPYVATASGISNFSQFIVSNDAGAVPVSFISTKAFSKLNGVQVEWQTANEYDVQNFVIERSADGRNFTAIATVNAITNSRNNSYSYFDAAPNTGVNFYRIRANEIFGSAKYTQVLRVNTSSKSAEMIVANNPVQSGTLNLQLNGMTKGIYNLAIFNSNGQQVMIKSISLEGSSFSQSVSLPVFTKGIYVVQLLGNNVRLSTKITVD